MVDYVHTAESLAGDSAVTEIKIEGIYIKQTKGHQEASWSVLLKHQIYANEVS
jgi:hypothetical protein